MDRHPPEQPAHRVVPSGGHGEVPDPALEALERLCVVTTHVQSVLDRVVARAEVVREQRLAGAPYREIVTAQQRPLAVELLTQALDQLAEAGAAWRRAEARALHDEGLSQEAIGELFGVTRQRVSALLSGSGGSGSGSGSGSRSR